MGETPEISNFSTHKKAHTGISLIPHCCTPTNGHPYFRFLFSLCLNDKLCTKTHIGGWNNKKENGGWFIHFDDYTDSTFCVLTSGRYFATSLYAVVVNVLNKKKLVSDDGRPQFMYYLNDGIYGTFNFLAFNNYYTVTPLLLKVFISAVEMCPL